MAKLIIYVKHLNLFPGSCKSLLNGQIEEKNSPEK